MSDGQIRVRVGALADRSIDTVFGNVERRAVRMAENVRRAMGGVSGFGALGPAAERGAAQAERATKRAGDAASREAARASREVERHYTQQQRALEKLAREQDRIFQRQAREHARSLAAQERAEEAAQRRRIALQNRSFAMEQRDRERAYRAAERHAYAEDSWRRKAAYRTAYHGVIRYFPETMGHAARFGSDMLRAAGFNMDVGESVRRTVAWQGIAQQVRNQANLVGQSLSLEQIQNSLRTTSTAEGFGREEVARGVLDFGKVTGDPRRALEVLPQILRRAGAANATTEDMMGLAGDIASHLGDHVKDKAGAVLATIDAAILQGAKGAIEIGNMARLFPSIGAAAGAFEGSEQQNMVNLGALAQLARRTGGARNPAEAVTAVARFKSQLTTAARFKQFKAAGVDVYSTLEPGKLRDPLSIIRDSILRTEGDPLKLNKMFMSTVGIKPVEALRRKYIEERNAAIAGGASPEEARSRGIRAMNEAIDEFTNITGLQRQIEKNAAERDQTTAVKAQRFRNQFDDITEQTMARLLPAFEKLAPVILKAAEWFGKLAEFSVDHWALAIAGAFTASIARAGLETILREGIEKMFLGRAGGAAIPGTAGPLALPGGGGGGGVRGTLARGAGGLVAGIGGAVAGGILGEALGGNRGAQTGEFVGGGALAGAQLGGPLGAVIGGSVGLVADQFTELWKQLSSRSSLFGSDKLAHASTPEEYDAMVRRELGGGGGGVAANDAIDFTQLGKAVGDGLNGRVLQVSVVNAAELRQGKGEGPRVDPTGRDAR